MDHQREISDALRVVEYTLVCSRSVEGNLDLDELDEIAGGIIGRASELGISAAVSVTPAGPDRPPVAATMVVAASCDAARDPGHHSVAADVAAVEELVAPLIRPGRWFIEQVRVSSLSAFLEARRVEHVESINHTWVPHSELDRFFATSTSETLGLVASRGFPEAMYPRVALEALRARRAAGQAPSLQREFGPGM